MINFSVIMPLFNKENDVKRAVQSILKQTNKNWELIIINDGSTDNSMQAIQSFNDNRITKLEQKNQGVSVARNNAILKARYEYICFLDADDTWEETFLEKIESMITNYPEAQIWATNYSVIRNGKTFQPKINGLNTSFEGYVKNYFGIASKSDPLLWTGSLCVTINKLREVGLFPKGVISGEDLITWAKIAAQNKIAWSNLQLSNFNAPAIATERKGREPQTPDMVAKELRFLLSKADAKLTKGLKNYLYMWHKNRANTYLQLSNKNLCFQELLKMAQYRFFHKKNILYAIAILLPKVFLKKLLKK